MGLRIADPRFAMAADASAIAENLSERLDGVIPGVNWNKLAVSKALPHRNESFVFQYTVPHETGGLFHLGGYLAGNGTDCPDWVGAVPGSAWLSEPGLAVSIPSADPKLKGVNRILAPNWAGNLGKKLGWKGELATAAEILAYRIEKRFVIRLRSDRGESAVIKVVRPRKLASLASAHLDAFRSMAAVVPEVLQVDSSVGALVMEDVPGIPLNEISPSSTPGVYAAVGGLLRSYHQALPDCTHCRTVKDELFQLQEWIDVASRLHPDFTRTFHTAFNKLAEGSPSSKVAQVRLHRDFYDKQIMVSPERLTLLDLDTATGGDPALDVGNFLAHIRLRQKQNSDSEAIPDSATYAFLKSYEIAGGITDRISWWRTASLLRLAIIYSFRPKWWHLTPELLEEVDGCLRKPELLT